MPRDETVLVLFFLVFTFDYDAAVGSLDRDLVGGELLDVQDDLEFVLVSRDGGSGILPFQVVEPPGPEVAGDSGAPEAQGVEEVVPVEGCAEVLVQEPGWAREFEVVPPVVESQWDYGHLEG